MVREEKIVWIPINQIKPDPDQPRKSFDKEKLCDSAESYKTHGTIVPIEIDEHNKIIIGELRWRSAKMAGLKEIPCIVKKGLALQERLERQLIENLNRQDIQIIELIPEIKRCLTGLPPSKFARKDQQVAVGEISKRLGVNKQWLSTLLKIDRMSKEIKDAVKSGEITYTHCRELSRLDTPEEQLRFLKSAKIMSRDELEQEISDYLAPRKEIREKIEKPEVRKKAFEELEKVEKWVKKSEKDIKKEKKEALKDIIVTGKAIEKGTVKTTEFKVTDIDKRYLEGFEEITRKVEFWTLSSIEIIKNEKYRIKVLEHLQCIIDHCIWLKEKCQGRDWYAKQK